MFPCNPLSSTFGFLSATALWHCAVFLVYTNLTYSLTCSSLTFRRFHFFWFAASFSKIRGKKKAFCWKPKIPSPRNCRCPRLRRQEILAGKTDTPPALFGAISRFVPTSSIPTNPRTRRGGKRISPCPKDKHRNYLSLSTWRSVRSECMNTNMRPNHW